MSQVGRPDGISSQDWEVLVRLAGDHARAGRTADLLEMLDHSFPVEVVDEAGSSLLMLAAYHGRPETVAVLLDRGADPDRLNDRGQSPLAGALFKGEDEVVALLLRAGADLDHGHPTARQAAALFGATHLLP